ncbi:hypothetical protein [Actinoplanes sp. NPDC049265]|uniref:hypothetical protein n=1 Tax=Actinoplanes sp. NPDC049265 TaxID=3363902 RepID=UPI00371D4C80
MLYLAGHGRLHNGRHYVLAASSPLEPPYFGSKAVDSDDLVQAVLNSGVTTALILLDACYSGFAAGEIQTALERAAASQGGAGMDLAVLVPSLHHQKSYSGLFVEAMLDALESGSLSGHWKDGDEFVTLFELRQELRDRLRDEQCAYVAGRDGIKILPNPRYRASITQDILSGVPLLGDLPEVERLHFVRKAASAGEDGRGWFFIGRRAAARDTVDWLRDAQGGVLVVTGAPGSGKSAFLGRMAVLADPASQPSCRTLGLFDDDTEPCPPVGCFDAVVQLKSRRTEDAAYQIANQLGIDLDESTNVPRDLVSALRLSGRRVTVLADSLDEAEPGEEVFIARDVLRAIANSPGCRVIVGTRRDKDGTSGDPNRSSPLIKSLSSRSLPVSVIDLDQDATADDDIEKYIDKRLAQEPRWATAPGRTAVAAGVTAKAGGNFLFARFAVRALAGLDETWFDEPDWERRLPALVGQAGLHEALSLDLDRFENAGAVRDALLPLAYARGKGLPRRGIWPRLATALANDGSGRVFNAADISGVIRDAGWYLAEGSEDGQSVYRLYHQSIGDYLRADGGYERRRRQ